VQAAAATKAAEQRADGLAAALKGVEQQLERAVAEASKAASQVDKDAATGLQAAKVGGKCLFSELGFFEAVGVQLGTQYVEISPCSWSSL